MSTHVRAIIAMLSLVLASVAAGQEPKTWPLEDHTRVYPAIENVERAMLQWYETTFIGSRAVVLRPAFVDSVHGRSIQIVDSARRRSFEALMKHSMTPLRSMGPAGSCEQSRCLAAGESILLPGPLRLDPPYLSYQVFWRDRSGREGAKSYTVQLARVEGGVRVVRVVSPSH